MEFDIKDFRKKSGLTQVELANVCGVSPRTVQNWESGRSSVPDAVLALLDLKRSKEYSSFKNEASFAVNVAEGNEVYSKNKNGDVFYQLEDGRFSMEVPLIPYAAYGRFANEDCTLTQDRETYEMEKFIVENPVKGNYIAFEVKGDSMDNGMRDSFESGDIILTRELNICHWKEGLQFKRRPYWVIVFGSSILIKQIVAQDLEKGEITCHSLSGSPEYHDFTLNLNEVKALFYVVQKKPKNVNY